MTDEKKENHKETEQLKIDFTTFISSLYMSAIVSMGLMPDPVTKEKKKNLNFSQQTIEILQILKEKTKGNLSEQEDKFLSDCIYNLMMQYVEAAKGEENRS